MRCTSCLIAALAATAATAQETVLGVYIFSRHGDRTAKLTPPSMLTDLGYQEVFTSGTYFRNRYISSNATSQIQGINSDVVKLSQITASAPSDAVLGPSAMGFLQGLYPPVGETLGSNKLANGTVVQTPLNGYQIIPLQTVAGGTNSENSAWLQGSTGCLNAELSSNDFYNSQQFMQLQNQTQGLYTSIYPDLNNTIPQSQNNYKNAYAIWDLLNVASIHNQSARLPDTADFFQLKTLADSHEWGLAFNESQPIRAVTGSILGAQVVDALNTTITGKGKSKINIQFGAYAGMLSYFGLTNLTSASPNFYGVPDYASTLTWELVTNATVNSTSWPAASDIYVRFLFHNGTTSEISTPQEFPLFGGSQSPIPWNDFVTETAKFSIPDQTSWCRACGNSTGVCSSAYLNDTGDSASSSSSSSNSGSGGISKAVAGVIGAMVTLGVILLVELAIILIGGFRLVSKKRLNNGATHQSVSPKA